MVANISATLVADVKMRHVAVVAQFKTKQKLSTCQVFAHRYK
jgi:hypothetical protein